MIYRDTQVYRNTAYNLDFNSITLRAYIGILYFEPMVCNSIYLQSTKYNPFAI